ncbi:nitroreductase family protein [Bifidobacterium boum]
MSTTIISAPAVDTLLSRRSIRKFKPDAIDPQTVDTLEAAAQHAASSQFLNDWSAIRITEPSLKAKLAAIGRQEYIATAPLLYVFVLDERRNAMIAEAKGVDTSEQRFALRYGYRFSQAQNDAVLALHAMETAAESMGLGCVILGSLLNDIPELIATLHLPTYTFPVLGLAIGKPDQEPALKPRMPRSMQFFDNTYPSDDTAVRELKAFDAEVHQYYDLRNTERPVDAFSDQIASLAEDETALDRGLCDAEAQGFNLNR